MTPVSDSQKKASITYKSKNIKRIPLDVQKEEYDKIKAFAESNNETVNGFIKRLIRQAMEETPDKED